MKIVLAIGLFIFLVAFGAMGYYFYSLRQQGAATQSSVENPFVNVTPSSNPFASPTTTTYQNPFSTTQTGKQPYQNPFEKLR